ncbi:MAG: AIM24 family protein, partial [Chloroflexota bacterium]
MKSHEIDYKLYGDDMQFVEVELDPGETMIAEAGTMMFMDAGMSFESRMGDGSAPEQGLMGKLLSAGKRALTGESIFLTHFTNASSMGKKKVSFAAPFPGKIIAIDLD